MKRKKDKKMLKDYIVAMSQKDLYKLGKNLDGVCLGHNCYLYENDLQTKQNICEALGYHPNMIKWYNCYQVAYCRNAYGNSGQLHRIELETMTGCHLTKFVYYTSIKYKE